MVGVTFEAVSKRYGTTRAVDGVSIDIADGAFFVVLGPAGCGKTTLLRLVAGMDAPDDGVIKFGDTPVSRAGWTQPPAERQVGMVFQSGALWPHLSVAENAAFALRLREMRDQDRILRVQETLAKVGLEALAERRPHELNADQRQRTALARCLVMRPRIVLLDALLSDLDPQQRDAMQQDIAQLNREIGTTVICATRDSAEALAYATHIAVMDAGRVVQVDAPRVLYGEPATEAIARLFGRGMVVPATVIGRTSERVVVDVFGHRLQVRGTGQSGERRSLCLRAEGLALAESGIRGRVTDAVYLGAVTLVTVQPDAEGAPELKIAHAGAPPEFGAAVSVDVRDGWIIPSNTGSAPASVQA